MKTYKQSILTIVIGLALAAGLSYAAPWTGPAADPTGGNTEAPINVGLVKQNFLGRKTLSVGGGFRILTIDGGLNINGIFSLADGSQGQNKILTSDAAGKGSWQVQPARGKIIYGFGKILNNPSGNRGVANISGTFTVPQGVYTVWVSWAGGGGGGGGGGGAYHGGGGGGGGSVMIEPVSVIPRQSINYTVGWSGLGGGLKQNGSGGQRTIFGNIKADGGGGGGAGTKNDLGFGGPGGNVDGASQGAEGTFGGNRGGRNPGSGGSSIFGSGGAGAYRGDENGVWGGGYGGGGGGGNGGDGKNSFGGHGSPGFILVEW